MANPIAQQKLPPEDKKDVDRLVNEGGPAPVEPKEVAKRDELWIESLQHKGGDERVGVVLDQETDQKLRQIARERGVSFENLVSTVLQKFSQDRFVERSH